MSTVSRRAFTLLEAVVALAVVGVAAVAVLGAFAADLRATRRVENALTAEVLATQRLSALRLLGPGELERLPDSLRRGTFPAPLAEYGWTMTTARVPEEDGLFELSVRIAWPGGAYALDSRGFAPPQRGRGRR